MKVFSSPNFFSRKQIQVDEIFVHENYTTTGDKVNDIALLRLGNLISRIYLIFVMGTTVPMQKYFVMCKMFNIKRKNCI